MGTKSPHPMNRLNKGLQFLDESVPQNSRSARNLFSSIESGFICRVIYQDSARASEATIQPCLWFVIHSSRYLLPLQYIVSNIAMNQSAWKYQAGNWQHIFSPGMTCSGDGAKTSPACSDCCNVAAPERWSYLHLQSSLSLIGLSHTSYCICTKCFIKPLLNCKNYWLILFNPDQLESSLSLLLLLHIRCSLSYETSLPVGQESVLH